VTLELGGKSPLIVFNDADLEQAAQSAAWSIFLNAGQMCFATSRLYVQKDVQQQVIARVCEIAREIKIGSGLDSETELGPVISERQRARVLSHIDDAVQSGAEMLVGGAQVPSSGFFVAPTVLSVEDPDAKIMQEEVFGPVLAVSTFETEEEVIRLANNTEYGLAASLWTQNLARAHTVASSIEAGTVWVNCNVVLDESQPFAGWKQFGHRRWSLRSRRVCSASRCGDCDLRELTDYQGSSQRPTYVLAKLNEPPLVWGIVYTICI
jgi:acyl-CoA reductase-like NAD-dependent aldehyde dehydrogenase